MYFQIHGCLRSVGDRRFWSHRCRQSDRWRNVQPGLRIYTKRDRADHRQRSHKESGNAQGLSNEEILATLKAIWFNGVAKSDQKATAKSLIHMCITPENAQQLGDATGVDQEELKAVADRIRHGEQLTQKDINPVGRFDTVVSAILDLGYERSDQFYRNSAKLAATLVAMALAAVCGGLIFHSSDPSLALYGYFGSRDFLVALLVGRSRLRWHPCVANSHSRGSWRLKQAMAVLAPAI
jgi:hypothetical protein